jgi:hypothetical protein
VVAADGVADVAYWRARAERAEALAAESGGRAARAEARAERAEARVAELGEQVGRTEARAEQAEARATELGEQVALLSRLLFGPSSEKTRPGRGGGAGEPETPDAAAGGGSGRRGRRGQRPGGKGHGRRDYSRLETREETHDVPPEARVCPRCGAAFEFLGSETGEQVDWRVTITRVVHRRLRYRRRCACPGPRTVTAPAPPRPIPKGRFTAAFLARLLFVILSSAADQGGDLGVHVEGMSSAQTPE